MRVLIVANQTAASPALISELKQRTRHGFVHFHLVVPALNSRLRHWLSDSDQAVQVAHDRGEDARSAMAANGISVSVEIGDSVPMLAIADALSSFHADEILISTLPAQRSHWLERDLINQSRQHFGLPVAHIIGAEQTVLAA
jgi:GABA permease